MRFGTLRIALLIISHSIYACAALPPFPAVWQCQVNEPRGGTRAFYCVNTQTRKHRRILINDPAMKGAQCLSAHDYAASESWAQSVKSIAEQRCH